MTVLPHELESEEYWAEFDQVVGNHWLRPAYSRPMFQVIEPKICERVWRRDEDCRCPFP